MKRNMSLCHNNSTHWGYEWYTCVNEIGHYWFRKWLATCSAPSHYLNQCCIIVNWTLRSKLQRNFIQFHYNDFNSRYAFEADILCSPECVNKVIAKEVHNEMFLCYCQADPLIMITLYIFLPHWHIMGHWLIFGSNYKLFIWHSSVIYKSRLIYQETNHMK